MSSHLYVFIRRTQCERPTPGAHFYFLATHTRAQATTPGLTPLLFMSRTQCERPIPGAHLCFLATHTHTSSPLQWPCCLIHSTNNAVLVVGWKLSVAFVWIVSLNKCLLHPPLTPGRALFTPPFDCLAKLAAKGPWACMVCVCVCACVCVCFVCMRVYMCSNVCARTHVFKCVCMCVWDSDKLALT